MSLMSFRWLGTARRGFHCMSNRLSHSNPLGLPQNNKRNSNLNVKRSLNEVKKILLVSSGKGGVGKSTVSVNLTIALKKLGLKVGLLDTDIYGPSIPKLMNLKGEPRLSNDGKLIPLVNYGIQTMSMGYLLPFENSPVVWRGLMIQKAIQQLVFDVVWNDLDLLVIDMPPGTGDVQLTLSQLLKIDGSIIVSTSQDLALIDVLKGMKMFEKVNIPIIGLVENMSYFICSNCNHKEHLFGMGDGVLKEAEKLNLKLLGSIPLNKEICINSDLGKPIALNRQDPLSEPYYKIAIETIKALKL
ncbi:hypothetical protein CANARDRAFT_6978 [[Candida] arabinofermentans NRRL YB-2248]|uniref:Uncharacterized protein n=1 Tax=[Candida] arabinofermentans NRRL YB-2248 TaxID=983967 RepID=A0A1E4T422_9ASCO|nr:hypothetical protein CANARDRAFT_6978 [[Candida] arabinofermentans NRRL YB-2248]